MKISQNCIDLIKKWEGLRLEAYLDPVGIPTIGYGTIRYPDGRAVRLGQKITEKQAEAYLQDECEEFAEGVAKLVSVSLNQNQFDALVSFCYNVGLGAFQESTLRKKLNAGDYNGAAEQFRVWNKGTINGVKKTLPGLVNRRNDEEALFRQSGGQGTPIDTEKSLQDTVTWLEAYRDGDDTVIVAHDGGKVVEILTLESRHKNDLIAILQQYKNASNFHLAEPGKTIPNGERISFSGKERPLNKVINPPSLDRSLLMRGMDDDEEPGNDIKELQRRLRDLGYYQGDIDGIFGRKTDHAVKNFQADHFGVGEADGKVGPLTWDKLWGEKTTNGTTPPPASTKPYLRLTKSNRKDKFGLFVLILEYVKNGKVEGSIEVCSGQPGHQAFRIGSKSISGSKEPLPEGKWYIHNIKWAGGKNNYSGAIFADGEGPVKMPLDYQVPGTTRRSAILFHIDWNRHRGAPGTLGCVSPYNTADMKTLVSWLRDTDPRGLYVDWGLGTCPNPE